MQVAVVDDTDRDARRMEEYLDRFMADTSISLYHTRYADGESFLSAWTGQYDLVIMDIDMPGISGVKTAKKLRSVSQDVVIMFVTNMPQYALAGYEVEAVDYIIKPVPYADFVMKLKKALRYLTRTKEERFPLMTKEGMVMVAPREVLYVESDLHYLRYHTLDQIYRVRGAMSDAEKLFADYAFARCSASFLVNLRHVTAVVKDEVTVGSEHLKISRGKRVDFMNRLAKYFGGMS